MTPTVTPIYAGLLALLLVLLSFGVIRARVRGGVSVGDGNDKAVIKAMRVQANCAEYAPIGIVLLLLAELQSAPVWALHLAGATLLAGRMFHAWGFGRSPQIVWLRQLGMVLTLSMLTFTAIGIVARALS